jgi:hypothetical protein
VTLSGLDPGTCTTVTLTCAGRGALTTVISKRRTLSPLRAIDSTAQFS